VGATRVVEIRPLEGPEQRIVFVKHTPSDPIQVIEALYAVEQPRSLWFQGVLEAAGSAFDRGAGVGFVLYDVSGDAPRVDAINGVNVAETNLEIGTDFHSQRAFARSIVRCYRTEVCATMAEHVRVPWMLRTMREQYAQVGLCDQVLINGANPSGVGCALYVFSKTYLTLSAEERALMTRLATHLSTAYRLQCRLDPVQARRDERVDAVMTVDGKVEHAESAAKSSDARSSLTNAVKVREWARTTSTRNDPERATAAWKPLVAGRWSLVDRFERDGRRYITARENAPTPTAPAALSPRERQVASLAGLGHPNKLIAYELGLAHSTVRVLLARAAAKLGARTRSEMVRQLQAGVLKPNAMGEHTGSSERFSGVREGAQVDTAGRGRRRS
jgi:DNA-binding CsgD family transcriptional regulator